MPEEKPIANHDRGEAHCKSCKEDMPKTPTNIWTQNQEEAWESQIRKQARQKTFKTIENWRKQQDFTNMSAGDFSLKLARQLKVLKSKEAGK